MLFVTFLRTESLLGDGEDDSECGTFVFLALESNIAMMEYHQVAGEGKSQTCTYVIMVAVFSVVETLEEVFLFVLRNAASGIAYINKYKVVVTACLHLE